MHSDHWICRAAPDASMVARLATAIPFPAHSPHMWRASLLVLIAVLAGCGRNPPATQTPSTTPPASQTNLQSYQAFGVVKELEADGKTVRIKHEEIPGYMLAMTMSFEVRDTNELRGIDVGDVVAFRLWVTEDDGWIDQVKKVAATTNSPVAVSTPAAAASASPVLPPGIRIVRDVDPLAVGDILPEYHFTNQFGKAISLGEFRGRALAITFVFTRCPFPLFCPRMMNRFEETQRKLTANANAPTNWHLLSLTIDPEFDTPDILRAYGERHACNPAQWTIGTGSPMDITALGDQFGLVVQRDAPGALPNHNLRTVIVDKAGRIRKILANNEWTSDELVEEITQAATGK